MTSGPTALVLGVGGNVSQGIVKGLRLSNLGCRIVGACVRPTSMGLYLCDAAHISPYAHDPAFHRWLLTTCEREGVDVVLSGVEPVLRKLSEEAADLRERTGAISLVSRPETLEIGEDKLRTANWLAEIGRVAPRSADAANLGAVGELLETCGLPLIAKPRRGKGSKGVAEITNRTDLDHFVKRPGYMLQERLGDDSSEYTVACLSDSAGEVRGSAAFHRGLQDGTTVWARVSRDPAVHSEAVSIVEALRPLGPCNVQMRLHDGRPICFELNVRFSGTAPVRARLGFNDVDAAIRHHVLGEEAVDMPEVRDGLALRYWNELYVDPTAVTDLERTGRLAETDTFSIFLENFGST